MERDSKNMKLIQRVCVCVYRYSLTREGVMNVEGVTDAGGVDVEMASNVEET